MDFFPGCLRLTNCAHLHFANIKWHFPSIFQIPCTGTNLLSIIKWCCFSIWHVMYLVYLNLWMLNLVDESIEFHIGSHNRLNDFYLRQHTSKHFAEYTLQIIHGLKPLKMTQISIANALIIRFDSISNRTDEDSFQKVKNWVKELRKMLGSEIILVIVGNKIDLNKDRTVPLETAERYAQLFRCRNVNEFTLHLAC